MPTLIFCVKLKVIVGLELTVLWWRLEPRAGFRTIYLRFFQVAKGAAKHQRRSGMSVAKVVEINASSPKGFEDAIKIGIERASKTLSGIQGAWVQEQKVIVEGAKIKEFRVNMKVTFLLEK